jgi:hypothetical protein
MRAKKLSLDLERLSVDSFETSAEPRERGTVLANGVDCTCEKSCPCPSAPYYCAEAYQTLISCDFSANRSCMTPPSA